MDEARALERLARERSRIDRALDELRKDREGEDTGLDQHPADDAGRLPGDDVDLTLVERLRDELAAVERAEERIAAGTYGLSVESSEPIPEGRLEAIPWAERTEEEQERYEGSR